jgi:hypothetical protein
VGPQSAAKTESIRLSIEYTSGPTPGPPSEGGVRLEYALRRGVFSELSDSTVDCLGRHGVHCSHAAGGDGRAPARARRPSVICGRGRPAPGSGQEALSRPRPARVRLYLTYSLRHSSLLFRLNTVYTRLGFHENARERKSQFRALGRPCSDSLPQGAVPGRRQKLIGLDGRVEVDDALRCRCAVDLDSGSPFRLRFRAADYDVRSSGMMGHHGRWL